MTQTDRTMLILCLGLAAFGVVYYFDPPAPMYYPVVNRWAFQADLKGPAMGWYGRSVAGLGAAAIAGLLLSVTLSRKDHQRVDLNGNGLPVWVAYGLAGVTATVLVGLMLAIVLHASNEWGLWGPLDG